MKHALLNYYLALLTIVLLGGWANKVSGQGLALYTRIEQAAQQASGGDTSTLPQLWQLQWEAQQARDTACEIDISLRSAVDGECIRFEVLDKGPGVSEEQRTTVFNRYARAENKLVGNSRGTGIGLTYCKLAIEAHGGRIDVVSSPEGFTVFCFLLPRTTGSPCLSDEQLSVIATVIDQPERLAAKP